MKELAIATYGLTKRFADYLAVNEVDLEIATGEVYGLIGANGAGKTTLIKLLAMVELPTKGEIYIHGDRLLEDADNYIYRQRIGYLPDDFPLYDDLTVWNYLDYFSQLYRLTEPRRSQRIYEVLELVQLSNKGRSLIATLSKGMRQRLSLARTIIHEPILLLLDEPLSGLDPRGRKQFREIIRTLQAAGMTILISSHILSDLAELCTSIGIMELGCLIESTSVAELCQRLSQSQITLTTLGKMEILQQKLSQNDSVTAWSSIAENRLQIDFRGSALDCAELLRSLILAEIPLIEFQPSQPNLEAIWLDLGHHQTS